MADLKISQMPVASVITGTELIPVVQGGTNKSVTPQLITKDLVSSSISGITGASQILNIVKISQASYNQLQSVSTTTLYVIV